MSGAPSLAPSPFAPSAGLVALLLAGAATASLASGHAAHAGLPEPEPVPARDRITIDSQVSIAAPHGMAHSLRSLGPRADALTLSDGDDSLMVFVYRRGPTDKAPAADEALRVHAEELERALGGGTPRRALERRVLGRNRPAIAWSVLRDGAERDVWLVAVEARGRTIVVSAVAVRASPNEAKMRALLDTLEVR